MALPFRGYAWNVAYTTNTITIDKPAGVIDYDFMLAGITHTSLKTGKEISAPVGWTQLYQVGTTNSGFTASLFYKLASSEGANYTFTTAGTVGTLGGVIGSWYQNIKSASPIDVYGGQESTAPSNIITVPSITTTVGYDYLFWIGFGNVPWYAFIIPGYATNIQQYMDYGLTFYAGTAYFGIVGATGAKSSQYYPNATDYHGIHVAVKSPSMISASLDLAAIGEVSEGRKVEVYKTLNIGASAGIAPNAPGLGVPYVIANEFGPTYEYVCRRCGWAYPRKELRDDYCKACYDELVIGK